MREIEANPELVAYCGLYCGACGAYRKGRCPGCHENEKAAWCKVRSCCRDEEFASCADCGQFSDPNDCKKFNNFFSKLFGLIFRSDRAACIKQIRNLGIEGHAANMAETKRQSMKRGAAG